MTGGSRRAGYMEKCVARASATMELKWFPWIAFRSAKSIAQLVKTLVDLPTQEAIVKGFKRYLPRVNSESEGYVVTDAAPMATLSARTARRGDWKSLSFPDCPLSQTSIRAYAHRRSIPIYRRGVAIGRRAVGIKAKRARKRGDCRVLIEDPKRARGTYLMVDTTIVWGNIMCVEKYAFLDYCHISNAVDPGIFAGVGYSRRLKLVTGVEISTRPARKSGKEGKLKNRVKRIRHAALKSSSFRRSSAIAVTVSELFR